MERLQEYDMIIHHIPGKRNIVPDALSRRPDYERLNALVMVLNVDELIKEVRMDARQDMEYQVYCRTVGRRKNFEIKEGLLFFLPAGRVPEAPSQALIGQNTAAMDEKGSIGEMQAKPSHVGNSEMQAVPTSGLSNEMQVRQTTNPQSTERLYIPKVNHHHHHQ